MSIKKYSKTKNPCLNAFRMFESCVFILLKIVTNCICIPTHIHLFIQFLITYNCITLPHINKSRIVSLPIRPLWYDIVFIKIQSLPSLFHAVIKLLRLQANHLHIHVIPHVCSHNNSHTCYGSQILWGN